MAELMSTEILLRDVTEGDLPILFEQQLDPEATAMAAFPSRDRESFMKHWANILANESVIVKTIEYEGRVAGSIVSWEMDGEWEVGYWLGREFWGKGIATQALAAYVRLVKTRPLFAHVARHNVGSRRVLEKCGFTVIGEDAYINLAGARVEEFILKLDGN